jgi:hypothetical protein
MPVWDPEKVILVVFRRPYMQMQLAEEGLVQMPESGGSSLHSAIPEHRSTFVFL